MTITDAQIKAYWADDLSVYPAAVVSRLSIPKESRAFLHDVGLPKRENLLFSLYTATDTLDSWSYDSHDYYVITEENERRLCIEYHTGHVWIVNADDQPFVHFVNTDIRSLVLCLQFLDMAYNKLEDAGDDEAVVITEQLAEQFSMIDARCMIDEDDWWPTILEQIKDGLVNPLVQY